MKLYKYLHPDRVDVLRDARVRFTPPRSFNDPFEMLPHVRALAPRGEMLAKIAKGLPAALEEKYRDLPDDIKKSCSLEEFSTHASSLLPGTRKEIEEHLEEFAPKMQEMFGKKFHETLGVLCLSEPPDSLLMWPHYADSHRGFVLEFNSEHPFFMQRRSESDEFCHLRKVTYQQERPSLILSQVEDFTAFLTKSIQWAYEAEWRLLMPLDQCTNVLNKDGELIHLFDFPVSAITGVVLGARMSDERRQEIVATLKSLDIYSHIDLFEVEVDRECYRLNIKRNQLGK